MSYFSLYLDYFYPRGGGGKLAEAPGNKITEFGEEILTNTRIMDVMAEKCLLTDQNNITYKYNNHIWVAYLDRTSSSKEIMPKILILLSIGIVMTLTSIHLFKRRIMKM